MTAERLHVLRVEARRWSRKERFEDGLRWHDRLFGSEGRACDVGKNRPRDLVLEARLAAEWRARLPFDRAAEEAWRRGLVVTKASDLTADEERDLVELMGRTRFRPKIDVWPLADFLRVLELHVPAHGDAAVAHAFARDAFSALVDGAVDEAVAIFEVAGDRAEEARDYRARRNAIGLVCECRSYHPNAEEREISTLVRTDPAWSAWDGRSLSEAKRLFAPDRWEELAVRQAVKTIGMFVWGSKLTMALHFHWRWVVK